MLSQRPTSDAQRTIAWVAAVPEAAVQVRWAVPAAVVAGGKLLAVAVGGLQLVSDEEHEVGLSAALRLHICSARRTS